WTPEFGRKLLACAEAAVDTQELQKVDDRRLPVELLRVRGGESFEFAHDIHNRYSFRRGLRGRLRCWGPLGSGRCLLRRRRLGSRPVDTELFQNIVKHAHNGSFLVRTPEVRFA